MPTTLPSRCIAALSVIVLARGSGAALSKPVGSRREAAQPAVQFEAQAKEQGEILEALRFAVPEEDPPSTDNVLPPLDLAPVKPPSQQQPRAKARALLETVHSIWDATGDAQEGECRAACVERFVPMFGAIDDEVCRRFDAVAIDGPDGPPQPAGGKGRASSAGTDGLARDSCSAGVDAGLSRGCLEWCDPREGRTHATFRFDTLFGLVEEIPTAMDASWRTCHDITGGGRRVFIQRVSDKERRQAVQTDACTHGFASAFASLVVTEQRLSGLDRMALPVVYFEHNVADNPRRRRFSYWWGGTDIGRRVHEECHALYRDDPEW